MGYLNCPICEKTEMSNVRELQHKIATALSKSHSCPICSAEVHGLQAMHLHLATHIPIESGDAYPNKLCSVAETPIRSAYGTMLASQDHIPSLERLDIQDDRYSPQTLVSQIYNSALTNSSCAEVLEIPKNEGPFQFNCDLCGLVFWSDHFLNLHKDIIHSKGKAFEVTCKQCKSRFKDLEAYKGHVKEAHSDRRYICEQCPKSFKVKGGLLVHTRMYHDQSTPSTCATCKKNFTSKARKELHDRRYHPAHVSTIGETTTLLANLINTTGNVDNIPGKYVNKIHQKLGRQSSSPAILTQSRLIVGDECREDSSVISSCTLVKDMDLTVLTGYRDGSNSCSLFTNNASCKGKNNCSTLDSETAFSNSDQKVVAPVHFTQGSFDLISANSVASTSAGFSNSNLNQRLFDNFKPGSQFELDIKQNCMQLGTIAKEYKGIGALQRPCGPYEAELVKPDVAMNHLTVTINTNPKYFEKDESREIVAGERERNFGFTQEIVHRQPLTNTYESAPSEMNFYPQSVESSPEHSVLQMKEALEELFVESPVSSPNEGFLSVGEKRLFSEGETSQSQKTNDLASKKNLTLSRTLENKQWECEVCKKGFTTKYFLKKHKRLHTGETPYCCLECGKNFTFQQSYHKHVLYHSDDKPHICPHCGRAFKEMSTLHNHIRIHTGEKPFTCITCGKSFRQRVSYLVHQRIHTGQMPYHCDSCNRSFRYKVSLRSHKCECGEAFELPNLMGADKRLSHDSKMLNLTTPEINSENQFHVTKLIEGGLNTMDPMEGNLQNQLLTPSGLRDAPNNLIGIPFLLNNSVVHNCDVDFSSSSSQNKRTVAEATESVNLENRNLPPQEDSKSKHLNGGVSYIQPVPCLISPPEIKDSRMEIYQCHEGENTNEQSLQNSSENLIKISCDFNEQNISNCNVLMPFESLQNKEPHCIFWYENHSCSRKDLLVNCNAKGSVNAIKFEGEKDCLKSSLPCESTQLSRLRCQTDDDDDQATFLKSLFC